MDIRNVIVHLEDTPYQNLLKSVESKLGMFEFDHPRRRQRLADCLIYVVLRQLMQKKYIFDYDPSSLDTVCLSC